MLAGGGLAGIAWETGILRGIADSAPDVARRLLEVDVLLGTSAGSAVAAQVGSGVGLDELFARQVTDASYELDSGVNVDDIIELFVGAMADPAATKEQKLQRIGATALAVDTVAESVRREVIVHRLPKHDWPERALRITAIDVATGELVVFDKDSGVELIDAVAASCAVPGIWPAVTIGGRRYIDGGVRSSDNADYAAGSRRVVVISPFGIDGPSLSPMTLRDAVDRLRADGSEVVVVEPDEKSLAAIGSNPLDPDTRSPAAAAGRAQGLAGLTANARP